MKKVLVLLVLFSLVLPMLSKAQPLSQKGSSTIVGTITSINSEEKSFELKIGGLALRIRGFFAALFSFGKTYSLVYKVLTDENTQFTKKSTTGVVNSSFSDLTVGLRVQVKGQKSSSSDSTYRGIIKADSVFILTPLTRPTITPPTVSKDSCYKNEDCTWCGTDCVSKEYLKTQKIYCAQVMPPDGVSCLCVRTPNMTNQPGKCLKVPLVPPTKQEQIQEQIMICVSQKTQNKLTLKEALEIAERDCGSLGKIDISKENNCNKITGTWWLGFKPNEPKGGCNPACVVNVDTKKAEINWRCTGALPPPTHPTSTIETETTSSCEVKCDAIGTRSEGWYLICQGSVSREQTKKLIKYDQCKNCEALCKYQNTPREGWYNSCNNQLILKVKCSK